KLASRTFSFRNLVFRILTRRICDYAVQRNRSHKKAQIKPSTDYTDLRNLWMAFVLLVVLALDDLYVVELHIEVARVNLLVLFEIRQAHRRRVVVLLDDLRLHRHTG